MSYLVGRPWGADQDLSNLLQKFNKSSLGIADPINLVKRGIPKDDSLVIDFSFYPLALVIAFGQIFSIFSITITRAQSSDARVAS
jgi:hypothetical protein